MPAGHTAPYRELLDRYQLLHDTDAALHSVLDSALIGVWDYDLLTRQALRSVSHDRIHGYSRPLEEWTFDTLLEHVAPEHRDLIRTRIAQCLDADAGELEFDCRIVRGDGTLAWVWSRGRVVRSTDGTPERVVGIMMDVSSGKRAAQELELERRRRKTFVATLAHELRQPLSVLLAAVELERLSPALDPSSGTIELMKRQIRQMNRVVDDLLDATRWACGKVTLRTARIDLRNVIRSAAVDIAIAVETRGQRLALAISSEPLWAYADAQRLQQVLSNLLRNAVKYTEPGGMVALGCEPTSGTVMITVADTGCGIEAEALPHIFDLFAQVDAAGADGLGIGLSVVREIVELHQGSIEARSEGAGRGSEFIVTLPAAVGQS